MLRSSTLALLALTLPAAETVSYCEPSPGSPAIFAPVLTVGEAGVSGEVMCGIPDGLGIFDNGDGTCTLLMNHELGAGAGKVRAHGSIGGFVSRIVLDATSLQVLSVADFNQSASSIRTWNGTGWTAGTTAYGRLCSADLPPVTAFYDAASGFGTQNRILLNGEEVGAEGRAFAHVATGPEAGGSWQLPHLGRASWENQLACPKAQRTTVVIGLDDASPGQLYVYVGQKRTTGNDIEKAGLVGGRLYGVRANATASELEDENAGTAGKPTLGGIAKGGSASFSLVDLGDASGLSGAQLQTGSAARGATEFLRPEDGAWDPSNPADFYFVTTHRYDQSKDGSGAQTAATRLWRLRFHDIADPSAGGSITVLLDGSETGTQMLDNLCVDSYGRVIMQEDPGANAHSARIWSYEIGSGSLSEIGRHRVSLFGDYASGAAVGTPASGFTNDEESSGIIDASAVLGEGKYLLVTQAHGSTKYSDGSDIATGTNPLTTLIEGGQLQVMTLAPTADASAPVLRNWALGARRGTTTRITAAALLAQDDRVGAAGIVYTVTSAPTGGELRVSGVAAASFTQADIQAGRVTYTHASGDFDRFTCSVSDGVNALAGQVVNISIGTGLRVQKIGSYAIPSGYDANGGVAEIVAFDPASRRLFVVNGKSNGIEVLRLSAGGGTSLIASLSPAAIEAAATNVTSVAVKRGILAVAVGNSDAQAPGYVFFYDAASATYIGHIDLGTDLDQTGAVRGALPDMLTFTPDGGAVLVAIEGEPKDDYSVDPHGGVVVIDLRGGIDAASATWCGFASFDAAVLRAAGVRIFNDKATGAPAASAAADLEPEYITVSADGATAYVTCQENNAVAVVNLAIPAITAVLPLGSKNWASSGVTLDPSDEDAGTDTNSGSPVVKQINAAVRGLYMPDGIAAFSSGGSTWLLTANEGDARAYTALNEEVRLRSASRDAAWDAANPGASFDSNLGRLNLTRYSGDADGDGDIDIPHAYGARSLSVWTAGGSLAWDGGNRMEAFFSTYFAADFNSNHNGGGNGFDSRSDDKGPEPEGVTTIAAGGRTYAAVGLERMGGFFLYDLSTPESPVQAAYYTGRHFTAAPNSGAAGDLGPEGILSIPAADSPTGQPLLVVGNEVSGTVAIHALVVESGDSDSGDDLVAEPAPPGGGGGGSGSSSPRSSSDDSSCGAGSAVGMLLGGLVLAGLRRRR